MWRIRSIPTRVASHAVIAALGSAARSSAAAPITRLAATAPAALSSAAAASTIIKRSFAVTRAAPAPSAVRTAASSPSLAAPASRNQLSSPSPYWTAWQHSRTAQLSQRTLHLHAATLAAQTPANPTAAPVDPADPAPADSLPSAPLDPLSNSPSSTPGLALGGPAGPPRVPSRAAGLRSRLLSLLPAPVKELMKLVKAELSLVVTFSSAFGFALAGHAGFSWAHLLANFVGTICCAFAAAIGNQYREIEFDRLMPRTNKRPLVTGYFTKPHAVAFGVSLTAVGAPLLWWAARWDPVAPALGLATIFLYVYVYTPLKRMHRWNTELGAIVGSMPVLIGWSCAVANWGADMHASGHQLLSPVSPLASLLWPHALFGIFVLYAWQMQHFMTIAFKEQDSYAAAGYVMMRDKAALHKGAAWVAILALGCAAAPLAGVTSGMYLYTGTVLNAGLAYFYYRWGRAMYKLDVPHRKRAARDCMLAGVVWFFLTWFAVLFHAQDNSFHLIQSHVPSRAREAALAWCTHPKAKEMLEEIRREREAAEAEAAKAVAAMDKTEGEAAAGAQL